MSLNHTLSELMQLKKFTINNPKISFMRYHIKIAEAFTLKLVASKPLNGKVLWSPNTL